MGPISDHFDGRRFFNPHGPPVQPLRAVPRMLLERRTKWPAWIDEPPQYPAPLAGHTGVVTFIGHATFLIQTASGHILTDPMFGRRAGPWNFAGPQRVRPPAVRFEDLPPIAVVLLSHNHYDHCDILSLRRLAARFDPLVVTPLGNGRLVRSAGIRRIEELDWWHTSQASPLPITVTPAHHFSARGILDRNRALWGGFMMAIGERRLYFAGDTAYAPIFRDIRQRLGPIDLALLPIGAYEPRWFMRSVHMNPDEAVQAHQDLGALESIGMHYGTFQLTTEGIDDPEQALAAARHTRGVPESRFRTLGHGDSIVLD
jgi:L-ascorbate metabolism protein UlaG (beta-lactamase superfamily)